MWLCHPKNSNSHNSGKYVKFVCLHSFNFHANKKSTGSSERPLKGLLMRLRLKQTEKYFNFNEGEYTSFDLFIDSIYTISIYSMICVITQQMKRLCLSQRIHQNAKSLETETFDCMLILCTRISTEITIFQHSSIVTHGIWHDMVLLVL